MVRNDLCMATTGRTSGGEASKEVTKEVEPVRFTSLFCCLEHTLNVHRRRGTWKTATRI